MSPETDDKPKCLLPLRDGTTFLSRLLTIAMDSRFITEACIVTGHGHRLVDRAVSELEIPLKTSTLFNPFYDVAGPSVSIWAAIERMQDQDFVVCNGDTFYNDRCFRSLWTPYQEAVRLCVDGTTRATDDDMKVKLDPRGRLVHVGKKTPLGGPDVVSTGLLMVKGPTMRKRFKEAVLEIVQDKQLLHTGHTWHDVLNRLAQSGVEIETPKVSMTDWAEADTPEELVQIRSRISGNGSAPVHAVPNLRQSHPTRRLGRPAAR